MALGFLSLKAQSYVSEDKNASLQFKDGIISLVTTQPLDTKRYSDKDFYWIEYKIYKLKIKKNQTKKILAGKNNPKLLLETQSPTEGSISYISNTVVSEFTEVFTEQIKELPIEITFRVRYSGGSFLDHVFIVDKIDKVSSKVIKQVKKDEEKAEKEDRKAAKIAEKEKKRKELEEEEAERTKADF